MFSKTTNHNMIFYDLLKEFVFLKASSIIW